MVAEDYCSFEVSKLLKEKGFDYQGFDYIDFEGEVIRQNRPTHQMAMKWLRQEKNIIINVWYNGVDWDAEYYNDEDENFYPITDSSCNSYEEAVEAALKYSLENLI